MASADVGFATAATAPICCQMFRASACTHPEVSCLNQHELIRKYRCANCGGVMMCACDEVVGRRFLAHQLDVGCELETQRRIPVTHGFVPGTCSECRSEPADPAPAAAIPGRTSKIKRYYWRELCFAEMIAQAEREAQHAQADEVERRAAFRQIEADVLDQVKRQHAAAPKYVFTELSQAEVLKRYGVEVEPLSATYAAVGSRGAQILCADEVISPEAFASRHYEALGWSVAKTESGPFHALFGTMMWTLIQSPFDPLNRVGFGSRSVWEARGEAAQIWTPLPEDFGTCGYSIRRADEIEDHLAELPMTRGTLRDRFDLWRPRSEDLRQYLWAHRDEEVDGARRLIEILPPENIRSILRYLVGDYWGRYLGWPDLLLHRGDVFRFVEVKSSSDRLSEEQKRWIADNHDQLGLPFALAKIHRRT